MGQFDPRLPCDKRTLGFLVRRKSDMLRLLRTLRKSDMSIKVLQRINGSETTGMKCFPAAPARHMPQSVTPNLGKNTRTVRTKIDT
eukprot:6241738-Amphidinium_carterae.1